MRWSLGKSNAGRHFKFIEIHKQWFFFSSNWSADEEGEKVVPILYRTDHHHHSSSILILSTIHWIIITRESESEYTTTTTTTTSCAFWMGHLLVNVIASSLWFSCPSPLHASLHSFIRRFPCACLSAQLHTTHYVHLNALSIHHQVPSLVSHSHHDPNVPISTHESSSFLLLLSVLSVCPESGNNGPIPSLSVYAHIGHTLVFISLLAGGRMDSPSW